MQTEDIFEVTEEESPRSPVRNRKPPKRPEVASRRKDQLYQLNFTPLKKEAYVVPKENL